VIFDALFMETKFFLSPNRANSSRNLAASPGENGGAPIRFYIQEFLILLYEKNIVDKIE
jgi:hypothetical protein